MVVDVLPDDTPRHRLARTISDVVECIADPVTIIGLDGGVLVQNEASVAALPKPPPRNFDEWEAGFTLHTPDGVRRLRIEEWPLARALRGEMVRDSEVLVLMPADPTQPNVLLASARPMLDEHGAVLGAVLISRDISAQRKLERELAKAQRLEAVGQLAAGVAHDFNNILTAISASAESLTHEPNASARVLEISARIDGAAGRGAELVQRLLAFARKQPLAPTRVEVNPLVQDLVALLRPTFSHDIDIVTDLGAGGLQVMADQGQLSAALLNLAVNARDAMPAGGQLKFRTLPDADRVLIEVSDTGVGIPFDKQPMVFEPFFTTKDVGKGTGLGLSMVYGFVAQSGGVLDLKSAPGHGATFSLRLPASA